MSTLAVITSTPLPSLVAPLRRLLPDMEVRVWPELGDGRVDVAVCWRPPAGVLGGLPHLGLIHSVGAGVDHILEDPQLPDVPICRIVDPSQTAGMVEFIRWAVLYFHRGFDLAAAQQRTCTWKHIARVRADQFNVTVLGLGQIGSAAAAALADMGYRIRGWARSARPPLSFETFHGSDGLVACLANADVVVSALPLTDQTRRLLSASTLRTAKQGVAIVNCGRGEQLDLESMRPLLDDGHVRGAVLDVFDQEPLPASHWAWQDPRIVVTPHMAAAPSVETVAAQVAHNVSRWRAGHTLQNTVSRERGY